MGSSMDLKAVPILVWQQVGGGCSVLDLMFLLSYLVTAPFIFF